jgi:hypothetical protein
MAVELGPRAWLVATVAAPATPLGLLTHLVDDLLDLQP